MFSIDASHVIASCDPWFACLFGFQDSNEVIGKDVAELIPSLKLPITMEELTQVRGCMDESMTLIYQFLGGCRRLYLAVVSYHCRFLPNKQSLGELEMALSFLSLSSSLRILSPSPWETCTPLLISHSKTR